MAKGGINNVAVDRFTAVHFAVGMTMGTILPVGAVALVAVAFELIEDRLKDRWPQIFPHPSHDTKRNALVDAGAMVLGSMVVSMRGGAVGSSSGS